MMGDSVTQHNSLPEADGTKSTNESSTCHQHIPGRPSLIMIKSGDRMQPSATGPKGRYAAMLESGVLQPDPIQAQVIERLQQLHDRLETASPLKADEGLFASLGLGRWPSWGRRRDRSEDALTSSRGLYIHGPVGRGKSMLMDLFFETAQIEPKRRVHFHAFMQEVHNRLNTLRQGAGGSVPG